MGNTDGARKQTNVIRSGLVISGRSSVLLDWFKVNRSSHTYSSHGRRESFDITSSQHLALTTPLKVQSIGQRVPTAE